LAREKRGVSGAALMKQVGMISGAIPPLFREEEDLMKLDILKTLSHVPVPSRYQGFL
jgi:hypothetical protein